MGWDRLRRIAAPAVAPLSYEDAKAHLRLDADDQQAEVEQLIEAAVAMIDGPAGIGLAMIEQTWRLTLDHFAPRIRLLLTPVSEIVSVKYADGNGDEQTVDPGDYQLVDDVLSPAYGFTWPTTRCEPGAVRIEFKAGYGAAAANVPPDLVAALKLIVRAHFDGDGAMPAAARAILDRYATLPVA